SKQVEEIRNLPERTQEDIER
ncbi:hypothetical protein BMETH_30511652156, partial [methanotrophic bacterial endosymbiont of Bathymodiolus sp.]